MQPKSVLAALLVCAFCVIGCAPPRALPTDLPTVWVAPTITPLTAPSTLPPAVLSATPATLVAPAKPTAAPTARATPTALPVETEACRGGERLVILLVEPRLFGGIQPGLHQFSRDLCADGYTVVHRLLSFATAPDLRAYLAQRHAQHGKLAGAIMIGEAPRAYQWVTAQSSNPKIPASSEEVISLQYYADLNGTFAASPGYHSPAKRAHSFDVHSGDLKWEIWVGLLPIYKGDVAKTIDALNRYFVKNHSYRLGQVGIPRAFLEISEHATSTGPQEDAQQLGHLRTGTYSWQPFSGAANAHLYLNTKTPSLSLDQGYADLSAGIADFAVLDAHGSYKASGKLTIAAVESRPLRTTFFWSNGCAVGNIDYPDNFLTAALYSPTSAVLVAKGTTNDSGGMGNNQNGFFGANIAKALTRQQSFGDAILSHVNVPLIHPWAASREFHYASAIVLGDPTLRLR